jgi:hypothetical protein
MAKTVAEKLLIKPNSTVWLSHNEHLPRLTPLPDGVRQVDVMAAASVAIVFAMNADAVRESLTANKDQLDQPGILWVAYPKANRADINRDTLWPIVGEYGMRPNGQVAVDDVWSALRFRAYAPGEAPFTGGEQP